jgi:hypothetical protein
MPLFDKKDVPRVLEVPNVKPISPTLPQEEMGMHLDTVSVFKELEYSGNFIVALNGSPDSVTYYSFLLDDDDLVINNRDVKDRTIKQCRRINNFEIRVTDAPTPTIDDEKNTSTVVASANIYPVITPLVGDILVKRIESRKKNYGIFQVTDVKRASMYEDSAWTITFSQIGYSESIRDPNSDPFVYMDFDFIVKNLEYGRNPLVLSVVNSSLQNQIQVRKDLIMRYYTTFFDKSSGTFVLPLEKYGKVVDPFIIKFWNATVDPMDYLGHKKPVDCQLNHPRQTKDFLTIIDAYLELSIDLVSSVEKTMRYTPTEEFASIWLKMTLLATSIDFIVFPRMEFNYKVKSMFNHTVDNDKKDDFYIFSESFYTKGEPVDLFEKLVLNVIKKQTILTKDVFSLIEQLKYASVLNQFYRFPFVLSLLQVSR